MAGSPPLVGWLVLAAADDIRPSVKWEGRKALSFSGGGAGGAVAGESSLCAKKYVT